MTSPSTGHATPAPRSIIALLPLCTWIIVALLVPSPALSHGFLDQDNDPASGLSIGCGTPPGGLGSLFQSFTGSASGPGAVGHRLVAVELRLRAGGSWPPIGSLASFATTVNIRSGSPAGPILATATETVAGLTVGQDLLVHFDIHGQPPKLEAGATYVIEWVTVGDAILTWIATTGAPGSGGPYAGGTAFGCTGVAAPDEDFNFKTFVVPGP